MKKFKVSSVVLTCDSYLKKSGCIEHTILSLLNQKDIDQEIIVVDNSQTIESRIFLQDFISSLKEPINVIETKTSISKARNLGAYSSLGEVIVLMKIQLSWMTML